MLLAEQKEVIEELITFLQDKAVGSIEFIAFSDLVESYVAADDVRLWIEQLEGVRLYARLEEAEINKLSPHQVEKRRERHLHTESLIDNRMSQLRQAEVANMLVERDI